MTCTARPFSVGFLEQIGSIWNCFQDGMKHNSQKKKIVVKEKSILDIIKEKYEETKIKMKVHNSE